jgi:hypothetical protein
MRRAVTLCLLVIAGCGGAPPDARDEAAAGETASAGHAPVSAFVPPSPAGCAGARAYDACFAIADATPLAVRVALPRGPRPNAVAVVRFRRVSGVRDAFDLQQMKFKVGSASELALYFQVRPGGYRISVGVDADGDGDPDGSADDLGWSSASPDVPVVDERSAAVVDVATTPIATAFKLAARQ